MKKSKLGKLQEKFNKSGFSGAIITNSELQQLHDALWETSIYMKDRGDSSMGLVLCMEAERVGNMLLARTIGKVHIS